MSAELLCVERIDTFYGEMQALFGVSMHVEAGEVVALLGPNGAGKTTTLRSILGLTPARSGSVAFDGRDIDGVVHFGKDTKGKRKVLIVPEHGDPAE